MENIPARVLVSLQASSQACAPPFGFAPPITSIQWLHRFAFIYFFQAILDNLLQKPHSVTSVDLEPLLFSFPPLFKNVQ